MRVGQSRSRAVGAFAVKMLGGDNSRYFSQGNPNMYVYDTLETVLMQENTKKPITDDNSNNR